MKIYYADRNGMPLPPGHRFPIQKYGLLYERVAEPASGLAQGLTPAPLAEAEQLHLAHTPEYVSKVFEGRLSEKETRRIGFPWSPALVERSRRSVGATIAAMRTTLQEGRAANLAGGTHHAYPDHGEGYCVFNDVAVAIRVLQAEGRLKRAVVIDCDVHQGNGTAAIFEGDRSVYTFSIHGQKNFPFHKEQSSLDIALPDRSDDETYLKALAWGVERSLTEAQADLAVYIAGADPYQGDQLGRMALTKEGLLRRDRLVFEACRQARLPLTLVMGGGYSKVVTDTVDIHFQTLQFAAAFHT